MTIDEAIEKYKAITNTDSNCPRYCMRPCDECVQECGQVAEWLEELKMLRKAFDLSCEEISNCGGGNLKFIKKYFIEEALNGGWIPCSERLPKESELVIIYAESIARGGSIMVVACLHNGFWFAQTSSDTFGLTGISQFNVIAWQPLPEPYKDGEKND